jgi:hypothetical protein
MHIIICTIIRHAQVYRWSHSHSFSTLRRLKTWLRSMMTEDRLSVLCLINAYHKVGILDQIDRTIDIFQYQGSS